MISGAKNIKLKTTAPCSFEVNEKIFFHLYFHKSTKVKKVKCFVHFCIDKIPNYHRAVIFQPYSPTCTLPSPHRNQQLI